MTLHIGLLVFPRVQQLDLTGPYEVFASLPGTSMHLPWKTLDPITSATGLVLTPTTTFADCPPLDVLCVPGGAGVNALMQDDEVLEFVRRQAAGARYVTSVCTGAFVLERAGLLYGTPATTHWRSLDRLRALGTVDVVEGERYVDAGTIVTSSGISAGIDMALYLVGRMWGPETARRVQKGVEYFPDPPYADVPMPAFD